jgi:hypothetical protein
MIIITLVCFLGIFWIYSLMTGYVWIIPKTKYTEKRSEFKQGDTVKPLANLDLSKGEWEAYLVVSRIDFISLNRSVTKASVLKTSDLEVLKAIQKKWTFKYTGGDMATAESNFYLFNGKKLVFLSGIILDESNVGLQSKEYGWLESINKDLMLNNLKDFKRVYWPIIVL